MRKWRKKKAKLNNAGMTLVEILIAMGILSVAIIPLMYAFVNVARYNARGRELQQTTVLAHSIIENCKAYSQEVIDTQILTDGTFLTGVTAGQAEKVGDTYYMQNVPLENQQYDVSLQFVPRGINTSATTSYDIMHSISMNPYMDAIFTAEGTTNVVTDPADAVTAVELDGKAYLTALEAIAAGIKAESETVLGLAPGTGIDLTTSYIEDSFKTGGSNAGRFSISREYSIIITDVGGVEEVYVLAYYTYELVGDTYTYTYAAGTPDEEVITWSYASGANKLGPYTFAIYSNSGTNDVSHPTKIENIYFFYYPAYDNALSLYPFDEDEIKVLNNLSDTTRMVNVYLIKQKNPAYLDASLTTLENSYWPTVSGNAIYGTAGINLYHNLNMSVVDGTTLAGDRTTTFGGLTVKDKVVEKESKTLMFDVVVNIYRAGSYDPATDSIIAGSTPILTMDGTDLDW